MKFTTLTVSALLLLTAHHSDAFQPAVTKSASRISQLDMAAKGSNDSSSSSMLWGPVATAVAGWTLASQVAMAASTGGMVAPSSNTQQDFGVLTESPTVLTAAFGAPSSGGGKSFDTMDFSMPSYEEGTTRKAAAAPSFNPFGDFQPEVVSGGDNQAAVNEDKAAAEAAKAEEKAAAAARKEEDKAAAATRKADEKAAAEADKAEKASADAAKKAEKAAKRQEELEKQRAAVERQKVAAAATSAPAAAVEEFKAPDVPAFKVPEFKAPEFKAPDFKAPDMPAFKMPEFKAPEFSAPSGDGSSAVKMPEFKAPDIKIPEFKAPDMPKFAMPKFDMPSVPSSSGDGYNLDTPKSEAPKVSMPSFSMPSVSAPKEDATPLEPQEVRDDRAREARKVYLAADAEAKEAEAAAKLVRDSANQSAKLASAAKDEACETKPGGKFICLRNPFSSGF